MRNSSQGYLCSKKKRLAVLPPKGVEMTDLWGKLLNEEHHNLYSLLSIIRMVMSRMIRWAGHVTRMEEEEKEKKAYGLLVGSRKERDH
jgi:hypothetical protein